MDNATHAFAGLLLADATTEWIERRTGRPVDRHVRRVAVGLGIIAAELPDADLLYSGPVVGMGKLGYLLHHRGHTHTIVFALAAAFCMWRLVLWLRQRAPGAADARERVPLLVLSVVGTLSHLLLDFTNSYGVHPFWPIDNRWVYGDAVFIVEPWLWVVAIPVLLFGPRRTWSRVVLSLLLLAILAAAWLLGELTPALATVVTIGAVLWLGAQRWLPARQRTGAAIVAWLAVEATFALSSAQAKQAVRSVVPTGESLADVVVSPGAGNPFCFDALVLSTTGDEYRVRAATVTPWPTLRVNAARSPQSCRARGGATRFAGVPGATIVPPRIENGVTWGDEWTASRAELAELSTTRCEVAAALRFLRVPIWVRGADGSVALSDMRFGVGAGGFSDLAVAPGPCTLPAHAWIPPWTPPRNDVLR
jgi:inner membrane protein